MSLLGALNLGQSALAVQQAALQTTGNNIANAANADYVRQAASVDSRPDQQLQPDAFVGTGVDLGGIRRQVDDALDSRLRAATADSSAAQSSAQWLGRVQAVFNELSDHDLSTQFSTFFNGWSALANNPQDPGLRQVVLQNGEALAQQFQSLRGQFTGLAGDVNDRLKAQTQAADALATQIAKLNGQIVTTEAGAGGTANALRDQRDADLTQLSALVDARALAQPDGSVNVYVGSEPLVLCTQSRGLALKQDVANGAVTSRVVFKSDNGAANVTSGEIGSLVSVQGQVQATTQHLDKLAGGLIFELNKVHASGQGTQGVQSVTASSAVADASAPLNDPKAGLKFTPQNGSFVVHVRQKDTGLQTSTLVQVNLTGGPGDTTLNSLKDQLAAIPGVSASISGGKLQLSTSGGQSDISFSQDSSGTLAALGVNNFFTGSNAGDIAVSQALKDNPSLLAASKNGDPGDNGSARDIAALESAALGSLGGSSLKATYQSMVNGVAAATANAQNNAEAAKSVQDTLQSQRQALSGVSLDEEAVNLLKQQRAFQGAARFISAVDEMLKTILAIT